MDNVAPDESLPVLDETPIFSSTTPEEDAAYLREIDRRWGGRSTRRKWQLRLATEAAKWHEAQNRPKGITLHDAAMIEEDGDDLAAKKLVKRWIDSKKIMAQSIGKCPQNGTRQLYKLSEILADLKKILGWTSQYQVRMERALTSKQRPASQQKSA